MPQMVAAPPTLGPFFMWHLLQHISAASQIQCMSWSRHHVISGAGMARAGALDVQLAWDYIACIALLRNMLAVM